MNAEQIIKLQQRLEIEDAQFRANWQETSEYIFPRESFITSTGWPGRRITQKLYDVTALFARELMASGMTIALVPPGQKFFGLSVSDIELAELDVVKRYMAKATEVEHEELFSSNFILQLAETLNSLITFGTGNLFSEWRGGLNFMDWDVSRYQIMENFRGQVDTVVLKFPKTARQAYDEWGDKAGKCVLEAMKDIKKQNDVFWFIHLVRPRKNWTPYLQDYMNMPFESVYVNVKDKTIIDEGGFPEFPNAIPRWTKTSGEVHGRGIGTMILPQVKMVNANKRDFNEVGNKYANPHREVLTTFEGEYKTFPGARNDVVDLPSSHVDPNQFGNFPITEKSLEMERQVIREAFFNDAFAPLASLTQGDRRTTVEIRERVLEAFRKIGTPIGRIESELFTPTITRCYLLLVRNGVIPPPPAELQGRKIKVIYKGPLSLAQQNAEVEASQQWASVLGQLEPIIPGIIDNIDGDDMARRMGRVFGVNEEDIASEEQREQKREMRRQEEQRLKLLQMAQVAGGAYNQTTKAPEPGSAAEQLGEVA